MTNKNIPYQNNRDEMCFGTYNVDGLTEDKLITLSAMCKGESLDLLGIQETKIRKEENVNVVLDGYREWRAERGGNEKGGGGLVTYVKDTIDHHYWKPDVPKHLSKFDNERQWLSLIHI